MPLQCRRLGRGGCQKGCTGSTFLCTCAVAHCLESFSLATTTTTWHLFNVNDWVQQKFEALKAALRQVVVALIGIATLSSLHTASEISGDKFCRRLQLFYSTKIYIYIYTYLHMYMYITVLYATLIKSALTMHCKSLLCTVSSCRCLWVAHSIWACDEIYWEERASSIGILLKKAAQWKIFNYHNVIKGIAMSSL